MTTTPTLPATMDARTGESPRARFWRRFSAQKYPMFMLCIIVIVSLVAIFAQWLTPMDPTAQNLSNSLSGPSPEHLLGTDELGRDQLSRLISATQVTMYAGAFATLVSVVIGLPFGLIAGFFRGPADTVLSRIADAMMAIPTLIFAMAIVAMLGTGVTMAVIAIGVANAPRFFRVARSVAMVTREETFVEAARSIGMSNVYIVCRHILPNVASPLIVQVSMTVGFSILFEAGLSFLGLGVQAPDASWGSMLRNSSQFAAQNPLLVMLPGLAILLVVLAFNTVGDAIRDSVGREIRGMK